MCAYSLCNSCLFSTYYVPGPVLGRPRLAARVLLGNEALLPQPDICLSCFLTYPKGLEPNQSRHSMNTYWLDKRTGRFHALWLYILRCLNGKRDFPFLAVQAGDPRARALCSVDKDLLRRLPLETGRGLRQPGPRVPPAER